MPRFRSLQLRAASGRNQTPRFAELGAPGEEFTYSVELRTMADVGLVSFNLSGRMMYQTLVLPILHAVWFEPVVAIGRLI